ncbi:hypothetical protein NC652_000047 [Populus alba x Populus x berolinensis]|nr:hypothetical protein NC652_000047 [Populus alba x Populus x berolinensis]
MTSTITEVAFNETRMWTSSSDLIAPSPALLEMVHYLPDFISETSLPFCSKVMGSPTRRHSESNLHWARHWAPQQEDIAKAICFGLLTSLAKNISIWAFTFPKSYKIDANNCQNHSVNLWCSKLGLSQNMKINQVRFLGLILVLLATVVCSLADSKESAGTGLDPKSDAATNASKEAEGSNLKSNSTEDEKGKGKGGQVDKSKEDKADDLNNIKMASQSGSKEIKMRRRIRKSISRSFDCLIIRTRGKGPLNVTISAPDCCCILEETKIASSKEKDNKKVREQLVPILRDYNMKPQALSSYVFIAANVILHASNANQSRHFNELLPPIIPLLTSHHHSLRGFTQLLVYQVFCKYFPMLDYGASEMPLEKMCFEDLKSYLAKNPDCRRLRASMEGYLDAYNPIASGTPAGIFIDRVEELGFECVPTSLMEEVLNFLNDVREDLRCSMAKDVVTINNESLKNGEDGNCRQTVIDSQLPKETSFDFQKKLTLSKHEKQDTDSSSVLGNNEACKQLLEMEKEDELLDQSFQSRRLAMEKIRASRQQFILVASLLDRIPNLAGLARTCEVFKASGLAIADASILRDKQFQLISVTAEKWVPIIEVPVNSVKHFLEKKKRDGFSILGLEQTANSVPLDHYAFPKKTVLVLGREKEGIPVDIIHMLDACIEIPQLGVVRSLNVHVSGAIALWEYTRQQRSQ